MIQFRWRKYDHKTDDPHLAAQTVQVGNLPHVLEYRLHFVVVAKNQGDDVFGLKAGRETDTEWRPVVIGHD